MSTCHRLDLQTLGSQPIMPKISPITATGSPRAVVAGNLTGWMDVVTVNALFGELLRSILKALEAMVKDGNYSEKALETEAAEQQSTSESSSKALAKQAFETGSVLATPGRSSEQQQFLDSRDSNAMATLASEGSSSIPSEKYAGWIPWVFSQAICSGSTDLDIGAEGAGGVDGATVTHLVPILLPVQLPVFVPMPSPYQAGHNDDFYTVPSLVPYFGSMGLPPGAPADLNFPSSRPVQMPADRSSGATSEEQPMDPGRVPSEVGGEGIPVGPIGQMQRNEGPLLGQAGFGQRPEDQRRVIRRFQVGIQLDLLLLLKLAVVVFVVNQDGSKDRFLLLLGLAGVIYLYQTGSLAPVLHWLAERVQHIIGPPENPPLRPDVQHPPAVQVREIPGDDVADPPPANPVDEPAVAAPVECEVAAWAGEPALAEPRRVFQDTFWGLVKELQTLIVGFVTSLLPGFHPHAD